MQEQKTAQKRTQNNCILPQRIELDNYTQEYLIPLMTEDAFYNTGEYIVPEGNLPSKPPVVRAVYRYAGLRTGVKETVFIYEFVGIRLP